MLVAIFTLFAPAIAQDAPTEPAEAPAVEAPTARTWALDPSKSNLSVLVKFDRKALIGGHDHIVQASTFDGTVKWNPADPAACDIQISFPVTALQVDPPGSRARAGLEGSTPEGDKVKIRDNALGKHQLQSDTFGSITFASKSCAASGERVKVSGELSIHGVSKSVTSDMAIQVDGDSFSANGTFAGSHGDWGMDPFSAALGALRNADSLAFTVNVKGSPK